MTDHPAAIAEQFVSLQIWPMGHGVVMLGVGKDDGAGKLVFGAVPDHEIREPGTKGEQLTWDSMMSREGPRMIIDFADIASVDRMIATLGQVKEELRDHITQSGGRGDDWDATA